MLLFCLKPSSPFPFHKKIKAEFFTMTSEALHHLALHYSLASCPVLLSFARSAPTALASCMLEHVEYVPPRALDLVPPLAWYALPYVCMLPPHYF